MNEQHLEILKIARDRLVDDRRATLPSVPDSPLKEDR